MKKTLLYFSIMMGLALLGYWKIYKLADKAHRDMRYAVIHVTENKPAEQMIELQKAFEQEGKHISFSIRPDRSSGKFNIYTAADIQHLPEVTDPSAINFLWIDKAAADEDPEKLRPFDVIVVKNMPAYGHLKAINMRTAFIPDAINIADTTEAEQHNRAMYWGDGKEFSLSLLLAGEKEMSLDIFGTGFEGLWPTDEIKAVSPLETDFRSHPLVLTDQRDEEIANETLNARIIKIIESGGVPYVRYNPGIEKLFGEAVPMYYNGPEFGKKMEALLQNPAELAKRRKAIRRLAQLWKSNSQDRKFIELFEIMDKKRQ